MPGDTVVPAIATRTGWNTLPGLTPLALDHLAQRRLDVLDRERLGARQRLARGLAGDSTPPSRRDHLLERRRIVGRARRTGTPTSGQNSASVWIFSSEISTAPPQAGRGR